MRIIFYFAILGLLFAVHGLEEHEEERRLEESGICDSLKLWNVHDNTTERPLIIGAGYGTTATRAVRDYFAKRGLRVAHWKSMLNMRGSEQQKWHQAYSKMVKLTPRTYHTYDFRSLHTFVDVVLDTPITPLFPFLLRAYPKAIVVLTHRNSTDWAKKRATEHPISPIPLAEFVGGVLDAEKYNESKHLNKFEMHPREDNMAVTTLAFDLRNVMIKCMVEPNALFEVNYFSRPDSVHDTLSRAFDSFTAMKVQDAPQGG